MWYAGMRSGRRAGSGCCVIAGFEVCGAFWARAGAQARAKQQAPARIAVRRIIAPPVGSTRWDCTTNVSTSALTPNPPLLNLDEMIAQPLRHLVGFAGRNLALQFIEREVDDIVVVQLLAR